VLLIFPYSAQILLENALLCQPTAWNQKQKIKMLIIVALIVEPWSDVMEV